MSVSCKKKTGSCSGVVASKYAEMSATEVFVLTSSVEIHDFYTAYLTALAENPAEFPIIGNAWPVRPTLGLYASRIAPTMVSSQGKQWELTVTYEPLQPGEPNRDGVADNPLAWPKTYRWDWVEFEEAITRAKNVDAFTGGFGRAALTLGPVVNPAYQEYAEGLFDTFREGVIVVRYNVATLEDVIDIENTYQRTTNDDTVLGIGARRWKYLGVEDGDTQVHNEIEYRPVSVRVQLCKTTDRTINANGWKAFQPGGVKLVPAMVTEVTEDGTITDRRIPASEPLFIGLNGEFTTTAQTNTWRYLDEVDYAPLLED